MSVQIKGTGNSVLGGADLGTPLAQASGGTGGNYPVYRMLLSTPQTTNGAAFYDFLDVPSWCKRVTVMLNVVGSNGGSSFLVQTGDGTLVITGYKSASVLSRNSGNGSAMSTAGFILQQYGASFTHDGHVTITKIDNNTWIESHSISEGDSTIFTGAGSKTLSGALDRIRLTTVNGTDLFDGGTINCMYEGYL